MRCLVVGSGGQLGSYLSAALARYGDAVLGLGRERMYFPDGREALALDTAAPSAAAELVRGFEPDAVYYLAACHHAAETLTAQSDPDLFQRSLDVNVSRLVNFLDAIRAVRPTCRLFYASSSLIFGQRQSGSVTEQTPWNPGCIYSISKAAGMRVCAYYRDTHGVHACSGILFNHESPLRSRRFLSQKIVSTAVAIAGGSREKLQLGDLCAGADFGYAGDAAEAMRAMLGLDAPHDCIVATGQAHSVVDWLEAAFGRLGLNWKEHVEQDVSMRIRRRPILTGDISRLRALSGWEPRTSFERLVDMMVDAAMSRQHHEK